ncbi:MULTISPECIES: heme exporter protein CcmD [unclassified Cupriavidus]|uniref:heme exporter protein CcmD n=1 Tax=Cupriavidus sp. H19C3 TaxID=3241603 RepID=UPI0011D67E6E|nr:MAG: heme exporter protein CcmD [Cupriavidus sp.]
MTTFAWLASFAAFASFDDWVEMGGHGAYVWSAYGACLLLLACNAVVPVLARRRYLRDVVHRRRGQHRRGLP